jgi:deoxyadenosine/deoxycytidine kinase
MYARMFYIGFWVSVSGPIGAGKSTALALFKKLNPNFNVVLEDVVSWHDLLVRFYENPTKHAFELQNVVLDSMVQQVVRFQKQKKEVCITERCHLDSVHTFGQHQKNIRNLSGPSMGFLKARIDGLRSPDCVVFFELSAEKCLERIQTRGRDGESKVSKEYIDHLNKLTQTMSQNLPETIKQFTINVDQKTPEEIAKELDRIIQTEYRSKQVKNMQCVTPLNK